MLYKESTMLLEEFYRYWGMLHRRRMITAIRSIKYNYRLTLDNSGNQTPISTEPKQVSIILATVQWLVTPRDGDRTPNLG